MTKKHVWLAVLLFFGIASLFFNIFLFIYSSGFLRYFPFIISTIASVWLVVTVFIIFTKVDQRIADASKNMIAIQGSATLSLLTSSILYWLIVIHFDVAPFYSQNWIQPIPLTAGVISNIVLPICMLCLWVFMPFSRKKISPKTSLWWTTPPFIYIAVLLLYGWAMGFNYLTILTTWFMERANTSLGWAIVTFIGVLVLIGVAYYFIGKLMIKIYNIQVIRIHQKKKDFIFSKNGSDEELQDKNELAVHLKEVTKANKRTKKVAEKASRVLTALYSIMDISVGIDVEKLVRQVKIRVDEAEDASTRCALSLEKAQAIVQESVFLPSLTEVHLEGKMLSVVRESQEIYQAVQQSLCMIYDILDKHCDIEQIKQILLDTKK